MYGFEGEITFHVMFECEPSQVVWDKIYPKIKEVMDVPSIGNFWHCLFQYLRRDNNLDLCLIIL